jgi:hypothetical protein
VTSTAEQLQALLDIAGITPTDAEIAQLNTAYPDMRAQMERLWALDLEGAQPSLVFRAAEITGPKEA